jgi:hypothetical protein
VEQEKQTDLAGALTIGHDLKRSDRSETDDEHNGRENETEEITQKEITTSN